MKLKKIFALLSISSLFLLPSCIKETDDDNYDPEIETTFKLSEDQAISESISDDANVVFFETAANAGLLGSRITQVLETTGTLSCANVTVSQGSFPKTIVVDFGNGCTSVDGVSRSGKINIVLSDTVMDPGCTAVMTFENYSTAGFKVEGKITWTNTSTPNGISWSREIEDGRVIEPIGGYYWLHEGIKYVAQTAGANTPFNLLDDIYSVTGEHTITNPAGKSRTATITEALIKPTTCHNVTKGKIKIQGLTHYAIVDYGDGTCDRIATISIDGDPAKNDTATIVEI